MTWDELTALLSSLAQEHGTEAKVVPLEGLEAVFLHLAPVAWFSSMKFVGALNVGVYQGEENRLVGTEQIPLAELTPEFVRETGGESRRRAVHPVARHRSCQRFPGAVSEATNAGHGRRGLKEGVGRGKAFPRAKAPSVFRSPFERGHPATRVPDMNTNSLSAT